MAVDRIKLAHGGGGSLMAELISDEIVPRLNGGKLAELADSARLEIGDAAVAFTTDSFVVQPLVFPGGDIGRIAVCGTVNDLAARGARPIGLALAMIVEEGLSIDTLRGILQSVAEAAKQARVEVVTGDTKVVECGAANGLFLTTSGVGLIEQGMDFGAGRIESGDVVLINGPIGDHGIAVMAAREELGFVAAVESDVAPLAGLVAEVVAACGEAVKCMKDPTRGGLAANVNEMAKKVGFLLAEERIPVRSAVHGACEMLGLDVLTVANEGKMIFVVSEDAAERALEIMRANPFGKGAAIIGRADRRAGSVRMKTRIGGERVVDMPYGQELPRIC